VQTEDPLLDGPIHAPPGALINAQDQISAEDPTFVAGEAVGAVPLTPARSRRPS